MIRERERDCGELYRNKRLEFVGLARSLTREQLDQMVPATPAWSVHDVFAHLVGLVCDLNRAEFGSGDADAWTAAQVEFRRSRSVAEMAAEWDSESPAFEDGLRLFGYEIGSHYLGDLLQHVADVHHALGRRVDVDDSFLVSLDFYLDVFSQTLDVAGIGSVLVRAGADEWHAGSGEVVATLDGEVFDLFRAFGGRRSESQIRAMGWSGDLEIVLPLVSPFPLPAGPIVDR